MSETTKYLQDLHTLCYKNNLKEIIDLCEDLRQNKNHILGDTIKNNLKHVFIQNKDYFEKAFELFKEIKKHAN